MSYALSILSDAYSTFNVPKAEALKVLQVVAPMTQISQGRFDYAIPNSDGFSMTLTLDEVNEEGDSLSVLAAEENGEPWNFNSVPDQVNLISASLPFGLEDEVHFRAVDVLWDIANALGWRVLDYQLDRFIRPRYDTTAYLREDSPIADIHRRMALSLSAAGAQRASQSPATPTDHGRIHGFWGDWSMTMRLCDAPYVAREAANGARIHNQTPPWDRVEQSYRYIEIWGDADANMDYFNDYICVCQELESHFPGAVLVGADGQVI